METSLTFDIYFIKIFFLVSTQTHALRFWPTLFSPFTGYPPFKSFSSPSANVLWLRQHISPASALFCHRCHSLNIQMLYTKLLSGRNSHDSLSHLVNTLSIFLLKVKLFSSVWSVVFGQLTYYFSIFVVCCIDLSILRF